jgi:hypothetical protein
MDAKRGGDETSMPALFPESLVNIAHIRKELTHRWRTGTLPDSN